MAAHLDAASFVWHCLSNDVRVAAVAAFHLQETVRCVSDAARQNSAAQHGVDHRALAV